MRDTSRTLIKFTLRERMLRKNVVKILLLFPYAGTNRIRLQSMISARILTRRQREGHPLKKSSAKVRGIFLWSEVFFGEIVGPSF